MYSVTSMSNDPVYKDSGKKNKGARVELKQFTVTEHYEEEIDSPTFSPTPPPLRTIPPKQRTESNDPPSIVARPKKVQLQMAASSNKTVSHDRQGSSSSSITPPSNKPANPTMGIVNPVFDADEVKSNSPKLSQVEDRADDIYEEYDQEYENVRKGGNEPLDVFAHDTKHNAAGEGDYEEPPQFINERSPTRTSEYLNRQASLSGLPDMSTQKTQSAESPLQVMITRIIIFYCFFF